MKILCALTCVFTMTMALLAHAADLSGEYRNADTEIQATLKIEQSGSLLTGSLQSADWSIEFSGANDGSNMANVRATLNQQGKQSEGFMILRRHEDGVQVSLIIKSNRKLSGQYHFLTIEP